LHNAEVPSILKVTSLITGYDKKQVINGVTFAIHTGEVVALIGHNGAGKSSILKAVFGLLPVWNGEIDFDVDVKIRRPFLPSALLRSGIGYVPQGGRVFSDLTVREHLELGDIFLESKNELRMRIDFVLEVFPLLKDRLNQKAGTLSGGERQLVALARVFVLKLRLLLLDEPSLGLAPTVISTLFGLIQQVSRDYGIAILISEQAVREVLKVAQRAYVLRNGLVSFEGNVAELDDTKLRTAFL